MASKSETTKYPDLLGFKPGSPWQLAAELRGASKMADRAGTLVPYADLMDKAANAMDALLVALKEVTHAD